MKLKIGLRLTIISIIFLVMCMLFTVPRNFAGETDNTNRCKSISLENAATILAVSTDDLQKQIISLVLGNSID